MPAPSTKPTSRPSKSLLNEAISPLFRAHRRGRPIGRRGSGGRPGRRENEVERKQNANAAKICQCVATARVGVSHIRSVSAGYREVASDDGKGAPQFIGCKGSTNRRGMRQNGAEPRESAFGGIADQRAIKGQRRMSRVSKRSAGYREVAATMNPRTKDTRRANNPAWHPIGAMGLSFGCKKKFGGFANASIVNMLNVALLPQRIRNLQEVQLSITR